MLLEISQAFDIVNQWNFMKMLQKIFNKCKSQVMYLLINDRNVRSRIKTGEDISNNYWSMPRRLLTSIISGTFMKALQRIGKL